MAPASKAASVVSWLATCSLSRSVTNVISVVLPLSASSRRLRPVVRVTEQAAPEELHTADLAADSRAAESADEGTESRTSRLSRTLTVTEAAF